MISARGYGRAALQAAAETGLPVWLGISAFHRADGTLSTLLELGDGDSVEDLLSALAALEAPAPTPREPGDDDEADRPESRPPARRTREPGEDDETRFDEFQDRPHGSRVSTRSHSQEPTEEEDPPTDGRQLLGWASKQVPDRKGMIIGFGKKRGFRSKIVEWTAEQVTAAYRHARRAR